MSEATKDAALRQIILTASSALATVPVSQPPVPPTPPPAQPGQGSTVIHRDIFAYANNAELHAAMGPGKPYTVVQNASLISLDLVMRYLGHPTMRYDQPGGTSDTPQISMHLARPMKNLWLQVMIRWMPGFTTDGITPPPYGKGYKLLGMSWANYDSRLGTQIDQINKLTHHFTATTKGSNTDFVVPATYNEQSDWLVMDTQWKDGMWHKYLIHFAQRPDHSITSRLWVDDVEKASLRYVVAAAKELPEVQEVMIGQNFNQQRDPAKPQSLWIGDIAIVEGGDPYGKGA